MAVHPLEPRLVATGSNDHTVRYLPAVASRSCFASTCHGRCSGGTVVFFDNFLGALAFNDHSFFAPPSCHILQLRLFDVRGFCSNLSSASTSTGAAAATTPAPAQGGGKHVAHSAEIACLPHPRVSDGIIRTFPDPVCPLFAL